jgi:hypothetical protein
VPGPLPRGVEGLVEAQEVGVSSLGGKTVMGIGMAGDVSVSVLVMWGSELASGCVANEDLCDVDAVGSPSVRAMI